MWSRCRGVSSPRAAFAALGGSRPPPPATAAEQPVLRTRAPSYGQRTRSSTTAAWGVGPLDKFTVVTLGIISFSSTVALFCYRRYRNVVRDASTAVQGQATLDRLSLGTKRLSPVLEEAYHLHNTVSKAEFEALLARAGIPISIYAMALPLA